MMVSDQDRITVRNSLVGLTALQIILGAWIVLNRVATQDRVASGLNTTLFLLAGLSAVFASYVGLKPQLAPLRAGLRPLVGGLLLVSLACLAVVDYSALGDSGLVVPVVLVVSITVGYLRARSL
jgi:hypothetical protein